MIKGGELLKRVHGDVASYMLDTVAERAEARRAYQYYHGNQYDERTMGDRLTDAEKNAFISIDLSSPIIKAISGSEMINDTTIGVTSISGKYSGAAEKQGKWIRAGNRLSGWDDAKSHAVLDSLITGIGCVVNANDYTLDEFSQGKPTSEHVPYFLAFYDRSCMGGNINSKCRFVGHHEIVHKDEMTRYIDSIKDTSKDFLASDMDVTRLLGFTAKNTADLEALTHYYYFDYTDRYDVINPLLVQDVNDMLQQDEVFAQVLADAIKQAELSADVDAWSLTKKQYDVVNDAMAAAFAMLGIGFDSLRYSKRKVKTYCYAQIARGRVLVHEQSFRQNGHMLVFWQGEYDMHTNSFYGLLRKLSGVQDVINLTANQVVGYASIDMHGGRVHIKGDPKAATDYIKKGIEKHDTSYVGTTDQALEVTPKNKADSLSNSLTLFDMMGKLLPRTLGLDEMALFGVVESGDMTSDLFSKTLKQSRAVLQFILQSNAQAAQHQAHVMLALGRAITKPLKDSVITIKEVKGGEYASLTYYDLMQPYDIEVVEREMTADEKQATFLMLKDFVGILPPETQQAAIPTLLKYSRIDAEGRDALTEAMTPSAPQPNPLNDALLDSQAKLQYADAELKMAQAKEKASIVPLAPDKMQSEIDKNNAQAAKHVYG